MATFNIFKNTPLSFKCEEDYALKLQTETTRLFKDYEYYDKYYEEPYYFLFDQTDQLFFQYRTDYADFTITLYSESGTIVGTLTKILLLTYDSTSDFYGKRVYQSSVDLSSLSGNYYILISCYEIGKPIVTFISERFRVENNCPGLKLEWYGSDSIDDPFLWDVEKATLRIDGEIKKRLSGIENVTYTDPDGNIETTYARPKNKRLLQVNLISEYVQEVLDLAIQHDSFYVNGVEFGIDEGWEYEATDNLLYAPKINLTQKNYYNFAEDEELTGINPVYEDSLMMINDTDYVLINLTDKVKINN
jgi:hypothetical protein